MYVLKRTYQKRLRRDGEHKCAENEEKEEEEEDATDNLSETHSARPALLIFISTCTHFS